MTKVDKECILFDCAEYVDQHWARSPFGAAARRDLAAYETPGDWVLYAPASVRLKYGTAPPAFHPDHGFLDLKQQLALKLSVLREVVGAGIPGDDDATASEEAAAQAAPPLVAAETAEGAEPTELWGEGEAEEGPASAAPALDLLSSVVTAATGKRRADSTYPVPEGRAPAAKRLAPDVPRQKQRVVAGHSMNDLLAYAQSTPITLHVGRRWNELPRHRRERSVPCDNCVRLGIRCFDMVVGNPLLPSKKPIASCTGCYERRKGRLRPSATTPPAAALREADGHGPPVGFALDLLAAYCAQGRLEDAVNRLADGLPQGRLPVRLPERMAESMGARLWERWRRRWVLARRSRRRPSRWLARPSLGARPRAVPADDDDDEDDLYLEE
ncbi:uncharacterized protein PSFLO_07800 [Pseudozyma flocculosa]|uniref:Uncharacterized protein n=1 Tax=Pseudozyma flocculosa TaxID=84751 RepID=A0A5C3FF52_9BASI|nr:uncharacterized protein PSFLO_07800 [Pseudozyma flocculosa]